MEEFGREKEEGEMGQLYYISKIKKKSLKLSTHGSCRNYWGLA